MQITSLQDCKLDKIKTTFTLMTSKNSYLPVKKNYQLIIFHYNLALQGNFWDSKNYTNYKPGKVNHKENDTNKS